MESQTEEAVTTPAPIQHFSPACCLFIAFAALNRESDCLVFKVLFVHILELLTVVGTDIMRK